MVNEIAAKFETADGLIVGSPVYYGAAFVCARPSGASSSFDVLNNFFTNCGMPVVSSQNWENTVFYKCRKTGYGQISSEIKEP